MPTCSPRLDAERDQRRGDCVDPAVQLAPRPAEAERREDHGVAVGMRAAVRRQDVCRPSGRQPRESNALVRLRSMTHDLGRARDCHGRTERSEHRVEFILELCSEPSVRHRRRSLERSMPSAAAVFRGRRIPSWASSETRTGRGDGGGAAEVVGPALRLVEQPLGGLRTRLGPDATSVWPSPIASSRHDSAGTTRLTSPQRSASPTRSACRSAARPGAAVADLADQVVHHDGGDQPPADLGVADPGLLRGDREVAGRCQPRSAGQASPLSAAIVGLGRCGPGGSGRRISWTSSTAAFSASVARESRRTPPSGPCRRRRPGPRRSGRPRGSRGSTVDACSGHRTARSISSRRQRVRRSGRFRVRTATDPWSTLQDERLAHVMTSLPGLSGHGTASVPGAPRPAPCLACRAGASGSPRPPGLSMTKLNAWILGSSYRRTAPIPSGRR